jgi:hypothetical protein
MKETAQLFDRQRVVPMNVIMANNIIRTARLSYKQRSDHLYPELWTDAPDVTIEEAR